MIVGAGERRRRRRDHPLRGGARARHRLRPAARRPPRRHLLARAVLRRRGADGGRVRRDRRAARARPRRRARSSLADRSGRCATAACWPPGSSRSSTTSASSRCSPTRRSRCTSGRTRWASCSSAGACCCDLLGLGRARPQAPLRLVPTLGARSRCVAADLARDGARAPTASGRCSRAWSRGRVPRRRQHRAHRGRHEGLAGRAPDRLGGLPFHALARRRDRAVAGRQAGRGRGASTRRSSSAPPRRRRASLLAARAAGRRSRRWRPRPPGRRHPRLGAVASPRGREPRRGSAARASRSSTCWRPTWSATTPRTSSRRRGASGRPRCARLGLLTRRGVDAAGRAPARRRRPRRHRAGGPRSGRGVGRRRDARRRAPRPRLAHAHPRGPRRVSSSSSWSPTRSQPRRRWTPPRG